MLSVVSQLACRLRTTLSLSTSRARNMAADSSAAVSWGSRSTLITLSNSNSSALQDLQLSGPPHLQQIRWRSNRSRRGLYDGVDIRSGNRRSHSMRATRRKFKPNVHKKRLYSETLDEMIRFHVTSAALRSIDHAGGLDNYLLTSRHITEGEGLVVKRRILQKQKWVAKKKAKLEAAAAAAAKATANKDQADSSTENSTDETN